ncbi:unnamed protein product [Durusdinium trenchii]|uniref:Cyclin-dependent kinase 2 homolog n=1 Tax=Durusdinium trenchii TaxID=1381693 RepID=A0ABP0JIK4_9DINO
MARPPDKYQKLDTIGKGSCGVVSRYRCVQTGNIVAIKKVRFSYLNDGGEEPADPALQEQRMCMFGASSQALREVSLLRQLGDHPAIVPLLDVFTERGLVYMVFTQMDRDLGNHLQEVGRLPLSSLRRYAFQLLSGLAHCHSRCISHRDVKPQNILIKLKTDEVKLCDFSLSRLEATYSREKQTQRVASLWYRSPEIFLGAETKGTPVDLWSAGCVIAEMATSKPIFPARCEIGMLFCQFDLLGTPTEASWPGVTGLPYWSEKFPNCSGQDLSMVLILDTVTLNLLAGMLCCNPSHRHAAGVLLGHPCFLALDKTPPPSSMAHERAAKDVQDIQDVQDVRVKLPNLRMQDSTTGTGMGQMGTQVGAQLQVDESPRRSHRSPSVQEELSFSRFFGQNDPSQTQKRLKAQTSVERGVQNHSGLLAEEWNHNTQARSVLW